VNGQLHACAVFPKESWLEGPWNHSELTEACIQIVNNAKPQAFEAMFIK
jgi:hypothetical protein